jgi:hypothetical protein
MTAIAGLVHEGRVWIGGDSAGVAWNTTVARGDAKVFRNGEAVFGFTSSFRMGQLLRHSLELPAVNTKALDRWMCTVFVDAVRACLKNGGYAETNNGVESGGTFLVGIRGQLFEIGNDFQVGEGIDHWGACGCGEQHVLASLWTTAQTKTHANDPEARLRLALQAAENYSTGVRGPFVFASTDPWPAQRRVWGKLVSL